MTSTTCVCVVTILVRVQTSWLHNPQYLHFQANFWLLSIPPNSFPLAFAEPAGDWRVRRRIFVHVAKVVSQPRWGFAPFRV